ncbi:MAG: DUF2779 domain-containing protein [Bacilli bacterium]|nr:DUF2779 domain-containing protein [Bacilli bacterium]
MAITKTNFINYIRCRRYCALENIHEEKKMSKMTLKEYKKEMEDEEVLELLSHMFEEGEEEDIDLTYKEDIQLNAMMPYYKEVEIEAAKVVQKLLGGKLTYSLDTYDQESFDFVRNGIRYLCYVDIYSETDNEINIIEVKATTTNKYKKLEYGENGKEKYPLFLRDEKGIYKISAPLSSEEKVLKSYYSKYEKLKNRFDGCGKYIYDLSVQRYIIERDLKEHGITKPVNYYLAVLNADYVYDGYKENDKRVYRQIDGEDIISLFELNNLTEQMQKIIDKDASDLENYLTELDSSKCKVSVACALKQNTECKFKPICFKEVPAKNASFNYIGFRQFKDLNGCVYNKYDLVNAGYNKLDDIPKEWITNQNQIIQRDCYDYDQIHINKEKIKAGLNSIEYPIYHLDFESFPCPMPRFKGEKPYTQSCFEFSLHIEKEPGVCDKEKDNYVFLAKSLNDEREELVKALVDNIDIFNGGTMLAQNVTFERGRLKELAEIYPEYKEHLLKIREKSTDLLYFIRNNKELYEELGFDKDECNEINYYHSNQSGSYSIKKTLPLFTNLKYTDLEVQNGTQALVEYSKYEHMTDEQRLRAYNALILYCQQDTWAMVEILKGLRKLVE